MEGSPLRLGNGGRSEKAKINERGRMRRRGNKRTKRGRTKMNYKNSHDIFTTPEQTLARFAGITASRESEHEKYERGRRGGRLSRAKAFRSIPTSIVHPTGTYAQSERHAQFVRPSVHSFPRSLDFRFPTSPLLHLAPIYISPCIHYKYTYMLYI